MFRIMQQGQRLWPDMGSLAGTNACCCGDLCGLQIHLPDVCQQEMSMLPPACVGTGADGSIDRNHTKGKRFLQDISKQLQGLLPVRALLTEATLHQMKAG